MDNTAQNTTECSDARTNVVKELSRKDELSFKTLFDRFYLAHSPLETDAEAFTQAVQAKHFVSGE